MPLQKFSLVSPDIQPTIEFQRQWEEELTIDELKTHLLGRKVPIRSENPRQVVQEIYGLLLGH